MRLPFACLRLNRIRFTFSNTREAGVIALFTMAGSMYAATGPMRLRIIPADQLIPPSSTLQYKVSFSFVGGFANPAAQRDFTKAVIWSSSNPAVAAIDQHTGLASSTNLTGTTIITATSGPIHASVPLTVSTATLTGLAVTPANLAVPLGRHQQFVASGAYSDASQHDLTSVTVWNSNASNIATVDAFGLGSTHAQGSATISGAAGGLTASTSLTVTSPVLDAVEVSPQSASLQFPGTVQLSALGIYSDGSTKDLTATAAWSSSAPQVATVASSGLVSAQNLGSANVTGAIQNINAASLIMVGADPLGSVSGVNSITCPPGGLTAKCLSMNVSCPSIADQNVILKIVPSAISPAKGTIIFISGGGDNGFYDIPPEDFPPYDCLNGQLCEYAYGSKIVSSVSQAGFLSVIVEFNNAAGGWIQGPGGLRQLACRPATTVKWIYDNLHQGSTTAPFCATGQSAGSTAMAYSLSHYDLGTILSMVEETSGPVFAHINHGCFCDQSPIAACSSTPISTCYASWIQTEYIDFSYGAPFCSNAYSTGDRSNAQLFIHDSVLSGNDTILQFPRTDIHSLFGGQDTLPAVPEGLEWNQAITSKKSMACVADDGHTLPSYLDSANQIINDLETYCKLQ